MHPPCHVSIVAASAVDGAKAAGSAEQDDGTTSGETSTTTSERDSFAITSNTASLQAGDGISTQSSESSQELLCAGRVTRLSIDEVVHVLSFLSPTELVGAGCISQAFRTVLRLADRLLWLPHCSSLWTGKQRFHSAVDDFKKKCAAWAANFTQAAQDAVCKQQQPLFCLPFAKSLFEVACVQLLGAQDGAPLPLLAAEGLTLECITSTKGLWCTLPLEAQIAALLPRQPDAADEADAISWRFAYFMSLRDSKRSVLSAAELSDISWQITFKKAPQRLPAAPVQFANGMIHTPLHDPMRFCLGQGGKTLSISTLPALAVRRGDGNEEWKWIIENFFVRIESTDIPMPAYLKHLQQHTSMRPP